MTRVGRLAKTRWSAIAFGRALALLGFLILGGCLVPPGMNAPQQNAGSFESQRRPMPHPGFQQAESRPFGTPQADRNASPWTGAPSLGSGRVAASGPAPFTPNISFFQAVKDNTWRSRVPASALFPLVVRHLSESYIIRQTTPRTLSVQTDWDKFFVGGRLFRNRMSINLFQISPSVSEIVINNKVEYFQNNNEQASYGESDWIPTQDITNEKTSLIESLSQSLQAAQWSSARR